MGFGFNYGVDPTDLFYLHGVSACHGAVTQCLFVASKKNKNNSHRVLAFRYTLNILLHTISQNISIL